MVGPGGGFLGALVAWYRVAGVGATAVPATTYRFADGAPGKVGVIASVTQPFCDTCNRIRLTAEGMFRSCLFALEETDLRGPMREGASDDELEALIRASVAGKWAGHRIDHEDFVQPARSMSMIGG
jgi:cyclic pyranopterin phosphate synthase